ncbi:histidine phosphatase family protein [Labrenzia sp. DG1229]|uniref:histidine phosphatase family protein n=1 Tax=Labrenzia sp. DG1229 TaxID=681847 RepID=UPI00048EBDB5|nr:histidine phosphatase family protein [Labrenzia sp. DG1229]
MHRTIRYLSHPQVEIDPQREIEKWSLNDLGKSRVRSLAKSGALIGTQVVVSSAETKAIETAKPIAEALGCEVEVRIAMHENDRSATGFLPPHEFETVADQFFAHPNDSVRGWETAAAAQSRIVAEVRECLLLNPKGDVLFVGHGGVGTLLFCHLSGVAISREYDQGAGGGGCFFEFGSLQSQPKSRWRPLEELRAGDSELPT